jgi:hypothetical protein
METKSTEWIESREIKIKEAFEVFAKESGDAIVEVNISSHPSFRRYVFVLMLVKTKSIIGGGWDSYEVAWGISD